MRKKISGTMPFDAGVAMADNSVRLGDENAELFRLLVASQRSLCDLLIYANRTSDYAKRAQAVALRDAEVIRAYGQVPSEVPGIEGKRN